MSRKILIVEDERLWQLLFADDLRGSDFELVFAPTIIEAQELFTQHPEVALIAMDGLVPMLPNKRLTAVGTCPATTIALVTEMRTTFVEPIVAISSSRQISETLMGAGCSHVCQKDELAEMIRTLLK